MQALISWRTEILAIIRTSSRHARSNKERAYGHGAQRTDRTRATKVPAFDAGPTNIDLYYNTGVIFNTPTMRPELSVLPSI